MANDGENAAPENLKKGNGMKLAVIGGLVVVLLAGGGYFAMGMFSAKNGEAVKTATAKVKSPDKPAPVFHLKSFIVNLAGSKGRRYLKVTMSIQVDVPDVQTEIERKIPQLRDQILTVLSSKSYEDIRDTLGKRRLRREIVARVNRILKTGKAHRVFLTEFVIQ